MKKYILIFLVFTVFPFMVAEAQQNVSVNLKEFKIADKKEGYKEAKNNVKTAEEAFEDGFDNNNLTSYRYALEYYLKAYKYNKENAELNYKIGLCYMKSIQKARSVDYFKKAYKLKSSVSDDILLLLAKSYHLNLEFDKAITKYQAFLKSLSPSNMVKNKLRINKYVQECENAKELYANPKRILIDNIGSKVNSKYREYSAIITADEEMMIFVSRRPNTTGGERDFDGLFFEDIYVTYRKGGNWTPPKQIGKKLNTNKHDAPAGLSLDGTKLFICKEGDLYYSELKGENWSSPDKLPKTINSGGGHEASVALSPDGKRLYFNSNKETNDYRNGQHDIYYSELNEKGKWGPAKKLSSVVNTKFDERSLFLHPDGRTLYFSSEGHNTMGGYDIFKTVLDDKGKWSKPENLGYPINTPENDVFYVVSASGRHAYFTSNRKDGYGDRDIYRLTHLSPEQYLMSNEDNLLMNVGKPVRETMIQSTIEIKTMRLTIVKGVVSDAMTDKPVAASIEIIDNVRNELISTATSNSITGKYMFSLPSGKNYGIAVKAPNYLFHSENFNIPLTNSYQEITKNIKLLSLKKGASIVLKNIFFTTAKWDLRDESVPELNRLVKIMNDYPKIKIEISGHTDNTGNKQFNWTLSENRAKAVVDYLKSKGIAASRMKYKGYADTKPIATNNTAVGRQENRRVEFKVLE